MDFQNPSSSICFQDKIPPWGGNAGSRIKAEHDRATETWKSEGSDKNGRRKPRTLRKHSICLILCKGNKDVILSQKNHSNRDSFFNSTNCNHHAKTQGVLFP